MKQAELANLAAKLQMTAFNPGCFAGVVDNWVVTISAANGTLTAVIPAATENGNKKAAAQELKPWAKLNWNKNNAVLMLKYKKFNGTPDQCLKEALQVLTRNGYRPDEVCPHCGRSACDAAGLYNGSYHTTHRACLRAKVDASEEAAEKNQREGSYFTGILGGIMGMLVGTLPSLLVLIVSNVIYAVLFALIPISAYFGYKLLGGKMNRFALIFSIFMAILGVYILGFEYLGVLLMQEYHLEFGELLVILPELLFDPAVWLSLTGDMITEFIFAGLGLWFAWRIISGTAAGNAENAKAVAELAIDWPEKITFEAPAQQGMPQWEQ